MTRPSPWDECGDEGRRLLAAIERLAMARLGDDRELADEPEYGDVSISVDYEAPAREGRWHGAAVWLHDGHVQQSHVVEEARGPTKLDALRAAAAALMGGAVAEAKGQCRKAENEAEAARRTMDAARRVIDVGREVCPEIAPEEPIPF